jgi:hypothetical protein
MRMLRAYKLGIKHARDAMEEDLRQTRNSLEVELASLRGLVREIRCELERARQIERGVAGDRDEFRRLQ